MKLEMICNIIQDTSNVHITMLSNESLHHFCDQWKFHDRQDYLFPDTVQWLLDGLSKQKILIYLDCFRIRFTFLWIDQTPVAIGPYCTEILSETDFKILARQFELTNIPVKEVLTYRSRFPVIKEEEILHLAQCLTKYALDETNTRQTIVISANTFVSIKDTSERTLYKPYSILIQERYQLEDEFMKNIQQGNSIEALKNWRSLHNSVDYLKKSLGYTLENARVSAAITRTTIRVAGIRAGLPAELGDWMTSRSAQTIREARTIEEINKEHERLIQEYCRAIHTFRTNTYSSLVLSTIYHLEHMYQEEIVISDLANELNITVNHLINQFKKETGLTPGQYLRRERLSQAARLLSSSKLSIQEISEHVGIIDSNYFTKLFHREYKETPTEYRRRRKL